MLTLALAAKNDAPDAGPPPDIIVNGLNLSTMAFTPDNIRDVVRSYQPQIQECYEAAMLNSEPLAGLVRVGFFVRADGSVRDARVDRKNSIGDKSLHQCIVSVVMGMLFPAPPDGQDHPIVFPFVLRPQDDGD